MNKTLLFTLLALLGMTQMAAQEYEYVPFVREGVKWVYFFVNKDGPYGYVHDLALGKVYLTLELKGDTVINGKTYKAMHKYYGSDINMINDTIPIYLREENKIVYGIVPDGKKYSDCPIGNPCEYIFEKIDNGEEFLLYDFQDPVSYWDNHINTYDPGSYESLYIDTLVIGNHLAKRYVGTRYNKEFHTIEGIGIDAIGSGYTLFPLMPMKTGEGNLLVEFSHVIENGEIVYKGLNYDPQTGINEVVADQRRAVDDNYYNLMGQAVGKEVPSTPGIYIHQGRKIVVR